MRQAVSQVPNPEVQLAPETPWGRSLVQAPPRAHMARVEEFDGASLHAVRSMSHPNDGHARICSAPLASEDERG